MELLISIFIIVVIIILSYFFVDATEKRKEKTIQTIVSNYEANCRENCSTTREITDQFMKVSTEQMGSVVELHKKTLEILSGEKLDDKH